MGINKSFEMNYKILNLVKVDDHWECDVKYWKGCECSAKIKKVEIYQDKRPLKREVIEKFAINL